MRHLTESFAVGALRRGHPVEQFLGPVGSPGRPGVAFVEIRPVGAGFEILLHTVADVGRAGDADLYAFPPFGEDTAEEDFGRPAGRAGDPAGALRAAEAATGAVPGRWVNAGVVQDEYLDFVRAGRPRRRG